MTWKNIVSFYKEENLPNITLKIFEFYNLGTVHDWNWREKNKSTGTMDLITL